MSESSDSYIAIHSDRLREIAEAAVERVRATRNTNKVTWMDEYAKKYDRNWWNRFMKRPPCTLEQAEAAFKSKLKNDPWFYYDTGQHEGWGTMTTAKKLILLADNTTTRMVQVSGKDLEMVA